MYMYMYSLVSVFCSRHFSVKQLKFEIYIIVCITVPLGKNEIEFG